MAVTIRTTNIEAPVDRIFAYLVDVERHVEWSCPNGHAHCQHLLLGTSENIPIIDGQLQFGRWQRIFLIELDMPRPREVLVQVIGE